jgi:hypothetical protein
MKLTLEFFKNNFYLVDYFTTTVIKIHTGEGQYPVRYRMELNHALAGFIHPTPTG